VNQRGEIWSTLVQEFKQLNKKHDEASRQDTEIMLIKENQNNVLEQALGFS